MSIEVGGRGEGRDNGLMSIGGKNGGGGGGGLSENAGLPPKVEEIKTRTEKRRVCF